MCICVTFSWHNLFCTSGLLTTETLQKIFLNTEHKNGLPGALASAFCFSEKRNSDGRNDQSDADFAGGRGYWDYRNAADENEKQ